jgi:hypothetical protein
VIHAVRGDYCVFDTSVCFQDIQISGISREVAAAYVNPNPVPAPEDIACGPQIDGKKGYFTRYQGNWLQL